MRGSLAALLLLLPFVGPAAAGEDPPRSAAPPRPAERADAVVAAWKAKAQDLLRTLAEKDEPDPWRVADELCMRGEHDAADAYAAIAPRRTVNKLQAYVARRREAPTDAKARAALAAVENAAATGDWQRVINLVDPTSTMSSVVGIRLACRRGEALFRLQRRDKAQTILLAAAKAARGLGWLTRAGRSFHQAGSCAYADADWKQAASLWQLQLSVQREIGEPARLADTLNRLGLVNLLSGSYDEALEHLNEALPIGRRLGRVPITADTLNALGGVHQRKGAHAQALEHFRESLAIRRERGHMAGVAKTLANMADLERTMERRDDALEHLQQALAIERELGDRQGVAATLNSLAILHGDMGRPAEAIRLYEESLEIKRELGNPARIARTLASLATSLSDLGSYDRALILLNEAVGIQRTAGDQVGLAVTLHGLAGVQQSLGDYAAALGHYENALRMFRKQKDAARIAACLGNIGNVQLRLGAYDEALRRYGASLEIERRLGGKESVAGTLVNMANVYESLERYDEALDHLNRALTMYRARGTTRSLSVTLNTIGNVHRRRGRNAEALTNYEEALQLDADVGNAADTAATLVNIGNARMGIGQYVAARAALDRAVALLGDLPYRNQQAHLAWAQAELNLLTSEPAMAIPHSRKGVGWATDLAGGLAEGEGAGARDVFGGLFDTGYRAAARIDDPRALTWFLEWGRAASLRESLGSRAALEAAVLSDVLLRELNGSRQGERRALTAYRRAQSAGKRKAIRTARKEWSDAVATVERVAGRIQRRAKAAAQVTIASPDPLEAIQGYLVEGDALVLFGLTSSEAVAVVVEPDKARVVVLPPSSRILSAVNALLSGERHVEPDLLPTLHDLLIAPLALDGGVRRVLVSPSGRLAYVPFSPLLPQREVVYVPSGSTYGLLLPQRDRRGRDVLALGDPDYGASADTKTGVSPRGLAPLPATRAEVEAIGSTTLLGAAASERGLQQAIRKRDRWRSVHVACHGLVDPEHPMRSALALTVDKENDGLLRALEIFRMKIPADLVVLSACETARGRVYETEGIVGLTRAFMYAGAPRVICSLWKVDDEATQALMIKFYALWAGPEKRMRAAQALKQAQAYVRAHPDHPEWKHPYYWAAWVLWGLP